MGAGLAFKHSGSVIGDKSLTEFTRLRIKLRPGRQSTQRMIWSCPALRRCFRLRSSSYDGTSPSTALRTGRINGLVLHYNLMDSLIFSDIGRIAQHRWSTNRS